MSDTCLDLFDNWKVGSGFPEELRGVSLRNVDIVEGQLMELQKGNKELDLKKWLGLQRIHKGEESRPFLFLFLRRSSCSSSSCGAFTEPPGGWGWREHFSSLTWHYRSLSSSRMSHLVSGRRLFSPTLSLCVNIHMLVLLLGNTRSMSKRMSISAGMKMI